MLTDRDKSVADRHRLNWERSKSSQRIHIIATDAFLAADKFLTSIPVNEFYRRKAGVSEDSENRITVINKNRDDEIKFRTIIYRKITDILKIYFSEKYEYLILSNNFDRSDIVSILSAYKNLSRILNKVSPESLEYIDIESKYRRSYYGNKSIADMRTSVADGIDFLSPLAETLPTNTFPYVKRAVDSAAKIYELCTGEKVSRNINRLQSKGSEEFRNHGMEFVYVLLHAIDNEIDRAKIRTYGRELPRP